MPKRRIIAPALCALLAILALLVVLPPRKVPLFKYLPSDVLAVGFHKDIRATWKSQFKHPAVTSILAGYGEEPRKLILKPGFFWTFLLAVGEDVASAVSLEADGQGVRPVLAAASPAGRRNLLLKFFWLVRWVPGLGRIHTDAAGRKFIDLTDDEEEDATPLILSVKFGDRVLRLKLSDRPEDMDDMDGMNPRADEFAGRILDGLPDGSRHRIALFAKDLDVAPFPVSWRDVTLDLSTDQESIVLDAAIPLRADGDEELRRFLGQRITGANSTAQALASAHAFALALLPAPFASRQAISLLGCAKGKPSSDDAVLYLTSAPYGAQLFLFAIPAVTASIPGIAIDDASLKSALRPHLPKQLRATFATLGADTICSSAASLTQQRHAAPPPPFTWQNAFARVAGQSPSAFLYVDLDPFFREARQIAQSVAMAASFMRDAIDPSVVGVIGMADGALPRFPTGMFLMAILSGGDDAGACKISLALSRLGI